MSFWTGKRVLVTGGNGFLGKHLVSAIEKLYFADLTYPTSKEADLRNLSDINKLLERSKPDIVIHAAAVCGGIEANRRRPADFFHDNAIMGIQLIDACRKASVKKFVCLGTICAYPNLTPVPFKEEDIWNGYPESTNAPYGLAKKMLLVQLQAYRDQYGFNGIYLLPVNMYGPGDNFDLITSHVIPALIRKMIEAKDREDDSITLWGTGKASREFLYVEDCVIGILKACESYNDGKPVNLGAGFSITIKDLAEMIAKEVGFTGTIKWDSSKPDGQPLRQLNVSKAKEFGFSASTPFDVGIRKTIEWYRENSKSA